MDWRVLVWRRRTVRSANAAEHVLLARQVGVPYIVSRWNNATPSDDPELPTGESCYSAATRALRLYRSSSSGSSTRRIVQRDHDVRHTDLSRQQYVLARFGIGPSSAPPPESRHASAPRP